MSDPTKVYCDNEELKKMILCVHPSKEGLFPHELSMLLYVSWGTMSTNKEQKWSGLWKYDYYVDQPQELFKSLIERGFIKESSDDELFDCVKMHDIQKVLKNHGIKPGNQKEHAKELLKQTVTGAELHNELGFRYYMLTETGKEAVDNNLGIDMPGYPGWDPDINNKYPALKADQIIKRGRLIENQKGYDLYIDSETMKYKYYYADTQSELQYYRVVELPKPADLHVYVDNKAFCVVNQVNTFQVLCESKMLLVGNIVDKKTVDCTAYDVLKCTPAISETINYGTYLNGFAHGMQLGLDKLGKIVEETNEGRNAIYYVSVQSVLAEEIITKYISQRANIKKIPAFLSNDITANYQIIIDREDGCIHWLILYLAANNMVNVPQIMGVGIYMLLRHLALCSDKKIEQFLKAQAFSFDSRIAQVAKLVSENISSNVDYVIMSLYKHYSPNAISHWRFSDYIGSYRDKRRELFFEIIKNKEHYDHKFRELLLSLREDGIVDVRWISEFSLYKLVLSFYEDTEYQKHFDWLGLQSLDIYIPQLKTGIEYQGEQHYGPIEVFGGEEGYSAVQERDERKKKLCKENGVRLIEWPYSLEITVENLRNVLK